MQTLQPAQDTDVLENDVLELDELWSFVYRRKDKKWVWLAQCRRTRQIVAFAVGDRSELTCRRLWLPAAACGSACRPLIACAFASPIFGRLTRKSSPRGSTVRAEKGRVRHVTLIKPHIERFNNTLRQRLARFVRQTMSFSKSVKMHKICLALFIYDYNRSRNNNRK